MKTLPRSSIIGRAVLCRRPNFGVQGISPAPEYRAATEHRPTEESAFTLLEVMIASAIFFMGMFAILGVLSTGLRGATLLQQNAPTLGMAIKDLVITNKLEEGSDPGDFGPVYSSFSWVRNKQEILTNGLFQVDVMVTRDGREYSRMSVLLFKPDSAKK